MKRMLNPKFCLLLILVLAGLNQACNTPEEGCLDTDAKNFAFGADENCEDCCEYPLIVLRYTHNYDSVSLNSLPFLLNDNNQAFKLSSLKYYISDLAFILEDGTTVADVYNTISLKLNNGENVTLKDNFALVKTTKFIDTLGRINGEGAVDAIRFNVGLQSQARNIDPSSVPAEHALHLSPDSLWSDILGYKFQEILLFKDTFENTDLTTINVGGIDERIVEVVIPINGEVIKGFDYSIKLQIDYKKWFANVDFDNDDLAEMIDKIVINIADAFVLVE